ncbi:hypothetical protein B5F40_15710 [Gordonibacter sp. An230]|uniref:hypothetical protein n=1 Tax=Gordonibacter sp. An230 TaxID=1965592 RepID=UPI000B36A962|nr:hypothetical protein [Gordonibacter sp. An230]OUO85580.1 hypothetical protein B5F40_15710 [Gordonibacter sp. An230]
MSAVPDARPGAPARARMRHRKIAAALCAAVALGAPAAYLAPLALQYAEGPSAEEAIADANDSAAHNNKAVYSLECEYFDAEGRTVYRLVSDTDPAIVQELRYGFRWLPDVRISPAVVPSPHVDPPGPYYELVNDDEFLNAYFEWERVQERREDGPGERG